MVPLLLAPDPGSRTSRARPDVGSRLRRGAAHPSARDRLQLPGAGESPQSPHVPARGLHRRRPYWTRRPSWSVRTLFAGWAIPGCIRRRKACR